MSDVLTVDISAIPPVYIPTHDKVVVRSELGRVVLFVGTKRAEMSTVEANKIGYTISMAAPKLEPGEMIVVEINKEKLELLKPVAIKVGAALLRKADEADDFQLKGKERKWL